MKYVAGSTTLHDTLNPKIWTEDNQLREDVKIKLNEVVDAFAEQVDIPLTIIDAQIVGSNASYNYNEHSDLDLHCIVNYSRLDADPTIVEAFMWAEKKLFNDEYNVKIRGIEVEVYVEDVHSTVMSNGIYSLFNEEWIKFPEPIEAVVDDAAVDAVVSELVPDITIALNSTSVEEVDDMIDRLYVIRHNGLATDGEYGIGNQAFKEIRNRGLLDQLKDRQYELKSEDMSIAASCKVTASSYSSDWVNDKLWTHQLMLDDESCFLRLCECRSRKADILKLAKYMYRCNKAHTAEDCVNRAETWVTDWNNQPEHALTSEEFNSYVEEVEEEGR